MSLEEGMAALTDAITALTDSNHHLAAAVRGANFVAPKMLAAPTDPADPKPKPRATTKVKEPPASPAAAAASTTSSTQDNVQGAAAGSAKPGELGYEDLAEIVPKVAEKHGRARAVEVFATFGVSGGKELQAKHPEKIADAVRAFRAALGQ